MADTTCHMSISLDGFVAGPDQSRGQPLGVARVLVADMVAAGLLVLHDPEEQGSITDRIDVLERVLVGLHRL